MQPLSARRMRILLRFRMGAHNLPVVLGRRTGIPRAQRLCQQCDQLAVGNERHMSALLCKLCGTNMVHCLLMVFPCIQPPGDASSLASSGAPRKEGGKYYILFQPPKADCMGCHPTKGSTKHTKQSLHGTIGA